MFAAPNFKTVLDFKWKDMHKKIGTLIVMPPTDSDLQEGQLKTRVWFVDDKSVWYLLGEF